MVKQLMLERRMGVFAAGVIKKGYGDDEGNDGTHFVDRGRTAGARDAAG